MKFLACLVASVAAIRSDRVEGVAVDRHNFPGVILANDHAIMPKASSPVDADFDPMFNKFRYA